MSKRLSPAAVIALKDALGKIYWYKNDLRSFLHQCVRDTSVLGGINWDDYKWQIASDVVDRLVAGGDAQLEALTRLCLAVCEMTSLRHLEQLDGGEQKASRAREAINHLRELVETHKKVHDEQDAAVARQQREAERLASSAAVRERLSQIRDRYVRFVLSPDTQSRGYELERILYDLFELFDLDPKASFRVVGEQIDGAFALDGTDYLLEAKWQKAACSIGDLDRLDGKIGRRLDNTLGVFLSINGVSADALAAFAKGRATMLVLDGSHLMAVLEGRIDLVSLLIRVRRHAARTGEIYLPLHEILRG